MLEVLQPADDRPGFAREAQVDGRGLAFYTKYIDAVTHAIQIVFLVAVPIAFVAFLLSFLLPEVELRKTVETVDVGEVARAARAARSSLEEIELALGRLSARENRGELYRTLAERAGLDLPPRSVWLLYRLADRPACTVQDVARRLKVDPGLIQPGVDGPGRRPGMVEERIRGDECEFDLTQAGRDAMDRLTEARRSRADRAARGLEPRGASRGDRDGQGAGAHPAGRRRAHGGRRHARRREPEREPERDAGASGAGSSGEVAGG